MGYKEGFVWRPVPLRHLCLSIRCNGLSEARHMLFGM